MNEVKIKTQCPKCKQDMVLSAEVPDKDAPINRGKLQPVGNIHVYRISSEMIKQWVIQKAKKYCPNIKVEVVPRYCEKKKRRISEPHRSYASLRIAFSEDILEKKEDLGWFGKIAESGDNLKIQPSMFQNIIKLYGYNSRDIDEWMRSYKNLEDLEESLGLTEVYLRELREFVTPQRVKTKDGISWIIFAAAAENIIGDMLTNPNTGVVDGKIQIQDVYEVNKDIVEFLVYLHPAEMKLYENPHVRQILAGDDKNRKK